MNPNSMTNERLCTLAQKGDEAAREILVEKNMGFIVQTADLIYRSSSLEGSDLNIDMDDLVQEVASACCVPLTALIRRGSSSS